MRNGSRKGLTDGHYSSGPAIVREVRLSGTQRVRETKERDIPGRRESSMTLGGFDFDRSSAVAWDERLSS